MYFDVAQCIVVTHTFWVARWVASRPSYPVKSVMNRTKKHRLNDLSIRRLIAKGEPVARSDGDGLTFTLSKAGTASWIVRYRLYGRRPEITIGNYPDISLADARKAAREIRAKVDRGEDPAAEKQQAKAMAMADWTVRELIADFKDKRLEGLSEKTIYYREHDLDKIILPKIGARPVSTITPADIVHMIETANRPWTVSKRLLTSTKQLFSHACGKRLIIVNPCIGIELTAIMGKRPPIRKRVMLSTAELQSLLTNIDKIGVENALSFRILLATCVRTVELVKARWEHIDFQAGTWWVPDESVKTRDGFLVPLTPTVISWFKDLKLLAGNSEWVLPTRTERRRGKHGDTHMGRTTLWAAITRAFESGKIDVRRFTPHDTRSTAKGHMRNLGISRDISEIALNHKLKGVEGIYDVREEIPERRAALETWAAFLAECEAGREWNVVPIRKQA